MELAKKIAPQPKEKLQSNKFRSKNSQIRKKNQAKKSTFCHHFFPKESKKMTKKLLPQQKSEMVQKPSYKKLRRKKLEIIYFETSF